MSNTKQDRIDRLAKAREERLKKNPPAHFKRLGGGSKKLKVTRLQQCKHIE